MDFSKLLPVKVRFAIYLLTTVGSAVMVYLLAKGLVGDDEMVLWAAVSGLANALAAFKTFPTDVEG